MSTLLALDLSTTCTGYSVFSIADRKLLALGYLKPRVKNPTSKGVPTYVYPRIQVLKMNDLVEQILEVITLYKPEVLAIEEVVSHKSRLTGKVLDGFHFILVDRLLSYKGLIKYVDVSGTNGWRTKFQIKLTDADKSLNKENKKLNKKLKGKEKLPIIDWKTLSARYVNKKYNLELNPDFVESDGDIADAIMVGTYYLTYEVDSGNRTA